MESIYMRLLRTWCDGMLKYQVHGLGPSLDGTLLCPACKHVHGRCPDAIYPLMCLADRTGEERYLAAAKELFDWHENLLCDDGSVYNDADSAWNGITAFAAVALHEALTRHGHLLTEEERRRFEGRMLRMGRWVSDTIGPDFVNNINYTAASAAVGAMVGSYFGDEGMMARAKRCAAYVFGHFTENGLLCGEGLPHSHVTPKGCRPIDIGYDAEESLGLLVRYAKAAGDEESLDRLTDILRKQLEFMLPDGAWDNSFGTRTAKWTYWGSRTSDGCQTAYALTAERDPAFAEAARRNTELMERCTADGLLYGGPDYRENGESPCIHHAMAHAGALAAALDAGIERYTERTALPCDCPKREIAYFPELDTYKLSVGEWRATVTGYDFLWRGGHATGGTMSLLWHERAGAVLLSSVLDYHLIEPTNMQLPLKKSSHRPLTPRLEKLWEGERYSLAYDLKARIRAEKQGEALKVISDAKLVSEKQSELPEPVSCRMTYILDARSVRMETEIFGPAEDVRLVAPVIAREAKVSGGTFLGEPEEIFFLTGGFRAREYVLGPDEGGRIWIQIEI